MGKKTFIVMAYHNYYPEGGFNDCQGIYNSLKQAEKKFEELKNMQEYDVIRIYAMGGWRIIPLRGHGIGMSRSKKG